ncbi:uncharacterized protein LOC123525055 isoform X2 [Mercenaria mercenaria]|uniref:uncharacterized protein LOC123525055 isoform X2 n=1 Tax=Mercenaria mercenaria TaxID=6596 RepID=UPI00234F864A|nr:uncharacterized protein LOC123525055 isoform X2 [Mercenaria mercenaria]
MTIERVVDAIRENDATLLDQVVNEDVNLNIMQNGTYPLHMCVGHVECVKVLLGHGANPGLKTQDGKQPIHLAVERDFVETLMHLVIHGADYDALTNDKTPLQIAIEEEAFTCQDFLQFLGAKIPENNLSILDEDSKSKYGIIRKGFEDGKIASGGREIPANSGRPQHIVTRNGQPVDISIQGYDESFIVYVCRMEVEYQSSTTRIPMVSIPEGMELISDIYQYRVEKNITCDVHIPLSGMDKPDKYRELVVIQMTDVGKNSQEEHRNVDIVKSKAVIKGITLCAYGSSPIVSFGIFMSIKTDSKKVEPNQDMTIQSSVEQLFAVKVPAGGAPDSTEITLQVMRAESPEKSSDSGFGSHSDFHSVASISTQTSVGHTSIASQDHAVDVSRSSSAASNRSYNKDEFYIKLPKPKEENGLQTAVLKCPQGADGAESGNWEIHVNVEAKGKVVKCKDAEFANYIVLNVKKIGYLIKEFVSELFSRSKGNKQLCKLFAMVNHRINTSEYVVQVVLCHENDYENRLQDWLNRNFEEQECGPTDPFEIDTKCTYMLKFNLKGAKVILGSDILPIQYQGKHPKSQQFTVETESCGDIPSGRVLSFKKNVPKKIEDYGKKCIATLAIRFSACKINSISPDKFLSDKIIEDIAQRRIGDKWFSLGIHLGFTCEELFAFQDMGPVKRSGMILFKWRDDQSSSWDEKLDNFVLATRQAELPKVKEAVLKDVMKFQRNDAGLRKWLKKYAEQGRDEQEVKFSFKILRVKPVSPLDDKFLLFTAKQLGGEDDRIFIELGLSYSEREVKINDPTQRRCKLLMLARDKFSSCTDFLKKLKDKLPKLQLNLMVEEISECARKWLNSEEAKHVDRRTRESLQAIFKQ